MDETETPPASKAKRAPRVRVHPRVRYRASIYIAADVDATLAGAATDEHLEKPSGDLARIDIDDLGEEALHSLVNNVGAWMQEHERATADPKPPVAAPASTSQEGSPSSAGVVKAGSGATTTTARTAAPAEPPKASTERTVLLRAYPDPRSRKEMERWKDAEVAHDLEDENAVIVKLRPGDVKKYQEWFSARKIPHNVPETLEEKNRA